MKKIFGEKKYLVKKTTSKQLGCDLKIFTCSLAGGIQPNIGKPLYKDTKVFFRYGTNCDKMCQNNSCSLGLYKYE